ncbi:MAG: hypothetical protein ACRD82_04135, partial [Blastocatellia bacterium]
MFSNYSKFILIISISFLIALFANQTQAQSGGQFVIKQSVIASGGGTSNAGNFNITGTSGQAAAGTT